MARQPQLPDYENHPTYKTLWQQYFADDEEIKVVNLCESLNKLYVRTDGVPVKWRAEWMKVED